MGKIYLLDCTLRDGGYVNDWRFGREAIHGIGPKLAESGIEIFEAGFIKGDSYDPDRAVYPDVEAMADAIAPKLPELMYVGMVDMSAPVPLERAKARALQFMEEVAPGRRMQLQRARSVHFRP